MATGFADVRDEVVEVCDGRLRLHVKVAGSGPPVVFFHPLPGLEWQPLLDRLAERYTVYAPEHPGTSPGDPQAIREVHTLWELLLAYEEALRALGLERPAVVGMSFGGMVAADLAASFPQALSRLVLLSSDRAVARRRSDPARGDGHGPAGGAADLPVQVPRERGGAGADGASRRSRPGPDGDRAGGVERRLHDEVRVADRRPRPRPATAPDRGADAGAVGPRRCAGPGRLRRGVRQPDRGQPSRAA